MSASHLTSEEREIFASYGRELAEKLGKKPPAPTHKVVRATIAEVGDYTYDVKLADGAVLPSIPRTIGAGGASVGDTCLLEWLEGRAFVTSVLANSDNDHYVKDDWHYLYNDSGSVSYRRVGGLCVMKWDIRQQTSGYWEVPATLPEEYRPSGGNVYSAAATVSATGYVVNTCAFAWVSVTGKVGFRVAASVSGARNAGTMSWALA